jgi:hypothetical protein
MPITFLIILIYVSPFENYGKQFWIDLWLKRKQISLIKKTIEKLQFKVKIINLENWWFHWGLRDILVV